MLSLTLLAIAASASLSPARLQCEAWENPLGVDVERPRLSWIVESSQTGQRQTGYRVLVASDVVKLQSGRADLWDSGKVPSDETRDIPYAGRKLQPGQQVFWNVQVWDAQGQPSSPSAAATWTMHILNDRTWRPNWIGMIDRPHPRRGIGFHALEAKSLSEVKWVQVDLQRAVPIDGIVLHKVLDHLGYAVFGFPTAYRVEISDDPTFAHSQLVHEGQEPESAAPVSISAGGKKARYVRVTATGLYRRKDGIGCFALSELEVRSANKNVAAGKPVSAMDSVERDGWTATALTDGWSADDPKTPVTLLLRKDAEIEKPVKRALAYVSGLGQYEMRINGEKVGQDWITPGWTQYANSVLVDSHDVTRMLKAGTNVIGLHLGNGMYDMSGDTRGAQQTNSLGTHKALCRLVIDYADGTRGTIDSDETWTCSAGPETYSGVFGGEDWDARLQQDGWDQPKFRGKWQAARVVTPPTGQLHGITHAAPPIRVIEVRDPVAVSRPKPNTVLLDLGQNAPYIPQIQVEGASGSSIRMWPAEMLKPDGTVDQRTIRAGKRAGYTLRGGGVERWNPIFWYCGSRYWQVEAFDSAGAPIDPAKLLLKFQGLLVHNNARQVGTFECSSKLFNQTYNIIHWAMRSNLASVISDCPHREKSGWLEEDHLNGPGLMYCFDLTTMFRKVVEDMRDTQLPSGMVPTMAPEYFIYEKGFRDSIEWGGTYLFLPRFMRDWYADKGVVRDHYATMKRYIEYLRTVAKSNILSNGLGDWNGYSNDARTPVAITDTAYYYFAVHTLAEFAQTLGKADDARMYNAIAAEIKSSFNREFLAAESGKVGTGSQSAQATALDLGLISEADRPKVFAQLLKDVEEHDFAVSCGEVGHPSLLRMLAANGRSDIVSKIHSQSEKPGYGYQINKGMTTLAEAWDASPISLNHFMLGHIMEWFYSDLVGIKPDPAQPGFRRFVIRPQPVPEVTWAKASYDSIRGRISSSWRIERGVISLDVEVPANTSAEVWMPSTGKVEVKDSSTGDSVTLSPRRESGCSIFSVGSGRFTLTGPLHQG